MERPKISIVVAAYNVESYIGKCLESLITQSIREIEILVVNDGSRDNTVEIADEFAKRDKRVKVISQENGGLSAARNTGIDHASGEFIAFVDGDDYLDKSMYETLYKKIVTDNVDLVVCGFKKVWLDGEANKLREKDYYFNQNLLNGDILENFLCRHDEPFVVAWNKLYRTEIIKQNRLYFENRAFFEDVGFIPRYLYFCNSVEIVNEALYYYIQRDGSITRSYNSIIDESLINTMNVLKTFFKGSPYEKYCEVVEVRLWIYLINYSLENKKSVKEKKEQLNSLSDSYNLLPFKHRIGVVLLKVGLYEILFKRLRSS